MGYTIAAMLNGTDAWDGVNKLGVQVKHNKVAARLALQLPLNQPGRFAKHVKVPVFFAVCEDDSCAPAKPTLAYAKQAPHPTIKVYEKAGHFDIYVGELFERASKDYVEFLHEHLPVSA